MFFSNYVHCFTQFFFVFHGEYLFKTIQDTHTLQLLSDLIQMQIKTCFKKDQLPSKRSSTITISYNFWANHFEHYCFFFFEKSLAYSIINDKFSIIYNHYGNFKSLGGKLITKLAIFLLRYIMFVINLK